MYVNRGLQVRREHSLEGQLRLRLPTFKGTGISVALGGSDTYHSLYPPLPARGKKIKGVYGGLQVVDRLNSRWRPSAARR